MDIHDLSIGERIHVSRLRKRLGQSELAELIGVSRPLVSKWERGASVPDLSQKLRLARLLDLPVDLFCDGDDLIDLRAAASFFRSDTDGDQGISQSSRTAAFGSNDLLLGAQVLAAA